MDAMEIMVKMQRACPVACAVSVEIDHGVDKPRIKARWQYRVNGHWRGHEATLPRDEAEFDEWLRDRAAYMRRNLTPGVGT
jgi:hypothetical protein